MSVIVLIGPSDALDLLRRQLPPDNPIESFTDHQVREAVEFIATTRPAVVAIDEEFALHARGEALVGRILDDPALAACEVRVLPRGPKPLVEPPARKSEPAVPVAGPPAPPPTLDRHGTRRAVRFRMGDGVTAMVDGSPVDLVDLSTIGAQVVSRIVLRPNQRVRVTLPDGKRMLRCAGEVVWAFFEMPSGQAPRYRAGLRLSGLEADVIQDFAERHKAAGVTSDQGR